MTTKTITPDKDALKRVGARVRSTLDAHPQAQKLPTDDAEIYAVSRFLSPPECQRFIMMIEATAKPSEAYETEYASGFRTSYSGNVDPHDAFVKGISARIDETLGLKAPLGESIQGQRYHPGQQFKPHQDYFHTAQDYWKNERKMGGQRSWTAMAFLNAVTKGGATEFTDLKLKIAPQPGVLLVWNNALPDGTPNERTMHAGRPVEEGVKYVITKWYRTRKWG